VEIYIALLRGINVGGKHLLPMAELVAIFESLRFENVLTYIQSGNVVFQSRSRLTENDAAEIERRVLAKKGFTPKVLLLREDELRSAVAKNPFPTGEGKALHAYFLEHPPTKPNTEQLAALKAPSEQLLLHEKTFYLYAPEGIGRSKLAPGVEKALGVKATARNWNTVAKLVALCASIKSS